jgi:two-component system, chemotaxis family, chemotaxis protein CheY
VQLVATIERNVLNSALLRGQPLVLIVDDDVDSRTLLELAFGAHGYAVATAANGREALASARHQVPSVILLDLAMPVMDGFAFRREQLADARLAAVPVVCVSGRHDAELAARQLGVHGCVPKPFDLERVLQCVQGLARA